MPPMSKIRAPVIKPANHVAFPAQLKVHYTRSRADGQSKASSPGLLFCLLVCVCVRGIDYVRALSRFHFDRIS